MAEFQLSIIDDQEKQKDLTDENVWKIAIIDDDSAVHQATEIALKKTRVEGRPLQFLNAYSGAEGARLLKENPDCAIALLDVVMEQHDAGLRLVEKIRTEMNLNNLQILLRTGQPGYAPEEEVVAKYHINDYKTKSELTRVKLFSSVSTCLRAYKQLCLIQDSKAELRKILDCLVNLFNERSVNQFADNVINQINSLFDLSADGIFCVSNASNQLPSEQPLEDEKYYYVVAATRSLSKWQGLSIGDVGDELIRNTTRDTLKYKTNIFSDRVIGLYLSTPSKWQGAIILEGQFGQQNINEEILKVLSINIGLGLENAKFFSKLADVAYRDELTGLDNRLGLRTSAHQLNLQWPCNITAYVIDVDYFHSFVATLGFAISDKILQALATRLKQHFSQHLLARLHADVFAIICTDSSITPKAIENVLSAPIALENGPLIRLGLTIGYDSIEVASPDWDFHALIRHAEMALKVCKEEQRGEARRFEGRFETTTNQRTQLINDFRQAMDDDELFLVLQPKVFLNSGKVHGYEALLRWAHSSKGTIPPNEFIPIVESVGLNVQMDTFVIDKAIDIYRTHPKFTYPTAVNISARSLHCDEFIDLLGDFVERDPACIHQLELEVTESALIQSEVAVRNLTRLSDLGFKICLDDFGTGYSSLRYLRILPFDVIKIDREFIARIPQNKKGMVVLRSVIELSSRLNAECIVEGVETEEQVTTLESMGVELGQGFYFCKPLGVEDAISFGAPGALNA